MRVCSRCGKSEQTAGVYCKYCKSIIEAKRRYKKQIEKFDNVQELYKFQRGFLYRSIVYKNRSLDFCSQVMEFLIEELESALYHIGYYNDNHGWCSNCAIYRPLSEFRKSNCRKKKHQDWCNRCLGIYNEENKDSIKKYRKQYHYDNREKHLKYAENYYQTHKEYFDQLQKEYYLEHRDERLKYSRNYYEENKEYLLKWQKQYYEKNKDNYLKWQKQYYQNHKAEHKFRASKRRALILRATPKWANFDKIKAIYEEADRLEKLDGIKRHVDHIIPLQNNLVCGLHVETNLQVLLAKDNLSKSNKFTTIIK